MRILLLIVMAQASTADLGSPTPYAGQEQREIKSLSASEIGQIRNGEGMGLARAAELNHYPGPRHVLELADELGLSPVQLRQTRQIFNEMQQRARTLGADLIAAETELDLAFSRQTIGEDALTVQLEVIGHLQARLRYTHLQAHLQQKLVLEPEQIKKYDKLRGYGSGAEHHDAHH